MDTIRFNFDNDKFAQFIMNSQFMNYIQENKQMVTIIFVWFFSLLITFFIQTSYENQNNILKNEVDEYQELIENIKNEKNNLELEINELNNTKNEIEIKNNDLNKNNMDLQFEIQELNLKISKLKEKNIILCESLEDFLSLRLKKRRFENSSENNSENIIEDTHHHNLRSLKKENS